jgi:O-antigen ligase
MTLATAIGTSPGWPDRVAKTLLVALPLLFLIGRAPADAALTLIGMLFLVRSALDRDWRWVGTPWVGVALALWLYLALVSGFAADPGAAYSRALPFGRFVVFAAALQYWLLIEGATRRLLLWVLALVLAFVVLDSLLQFATGRDVLGHGYEAMRLTGPFSGPVPGTFIARTCFPVLGLLLAAAIAWPRVRRALLAIALIVLLGITIALTGERMALLTFGLGVLVFLILVKEMRGPLLLAGLVGTLLMAGAVATSPDLRVRLIGHTTYDMTNFWERRYGELILRNVRIWWREPFIGIGLKNFRTECVNDTFEAVGPPSDRCYTHPHSVWLEWLVEAGAIGFVGFLILVGLWTHAVARGLRAIEPADYLIAVGALASLVVFLWPLRLSMSFFSNWNAILFWLVLGLALALCAPRGRPTRVPPEPDLAAGR